MKSYRPRCPDSLGHFLPLFGRVAIHLRRKGRHSIPGLVLAIAVLGAAAPAATAQTGLTFAPTFADFGDVPVNTRSTLSVRITNTSRDAIVLNKDSFSGGEFRMSGLVLPLTLASWKSTTMTLEFLPTFVGPVSGFVHLGNDQGSVHFFYSFSGTGVAATAVVSATPSSAAFTGVPVGETDSQAIRLANTTKLAVNLSMSVSGADFTTTGLTSPFTLGAGAKASFDVVFSPKAAGTAYGRVFISGKGVDLTIPLSGGVTAASRSLSASAASVRFGDVDLGSSSSQNVSLTNKGNSTVTVSAVSTTGNGVTASGVGSGTTLASNQSVTLSVGFAPKAAGAVTGRVIITSNATSSPNTISISGAGVARSNYSVTLSWIASTSPDVTGYNVYRSTGSSGVYAKIVSSLVTADRYTDTTVQAGKDYSYELTSVTSSGAESGYSSPVSVTIP